MSDLRTCRLVTLGCKVNQYETQLVREALLQSGYREATEGESADLCVEDRVEAGRVFHHQEVTKPGHGDDAELRRDAAVLAAQSELQRALQQLSLRRTAVRDYEKEGLAQIAPLQPPEIAAHTYMLVDVTANQVLASRDVDAQVEPASLT